MNITKHIEQILNILIHLELTKKDIFEIIDNKSLVQGSSFLYRTYQNSLRIIVIELYKLINPREDFSLIKLSRNIILHYKDLDSYKRFSVKDYKTMEVQLICLYESNTYDKINNLRNKHYAHSDKNRFNYTSDISLVDIDETLKKLQKIFSKIYLDCQNKTILFEHINNNFYELNNLKKFSKIRKLYFDELKKDYTLSKNNNLEIMKIIRGFEK